MGLYVEFDVIDDFGFLDRTEEYGIIPDYSEGCAAFVDAFLQYSTSLVPVRTGYLQSTLEADCTETSCYAETDCDYAQYVEYGTSYMGAQPYFEPALEYALNEAEPLWIRAEEDALLEEEMLAAAEEEERQMQQQNMVDRMSGGQTHGGLNYSSFTNFIASVVATLIVALITTFVQAAMGKDFSSGGSRSRGGGGRGGAVFVPEVIIT